MPAGRVGRRRLALAFVAGVALTVFGLLALQPAPEVMDPTDFGPLAEVVGANDFNVGRCDFLKFNAIVGIGGWY